MINPDQTLSRVHIRRAGTSDAALLAELAARLFEQTFGSANDPEDMRSYLSSTFSPELQSAELADVDRAVWIAQDASGAAIGYAMLRRGTRADVVVSRSPAEVQRIYVDRTLHGQRVGDSLMSACFDQARAWTCDTVWLAVWEENPRAIAFYRRMGFRPVGKQTFTLGRDLQHDIVMVTQI
jgi:ribosomal protein S18 acetylase RimI-like enzyme